MIYRAGNRREFPRGGTPHSGRTLAPVATPPPWPRPSVNISTGCIVTSSDWSAMPPRPTTSFNRAWLHVDPPVTSFDLHASASILAVRHQPTTDGSCCAAAPTSVWRITNLPFPPARRTRSAPSSPGNAPPFSAKLAELPVLYREALTLRFEEGMKLEEIAEVTHTPLSTVKSRVRRGLEAMKQKICKEDIV